MILAVDVGGTKTALALYDDDCKRLVQDTLPSRKYDGLEALVSDFLNQQDVTVQKAVFGVAGPVHYGRAQLTNLPWAITETALSRDCGIEAVKLLNDLEAMVYAIPYLGTDDVQRVNDAAGTSKGNIGLLAPGTGLGEAFLTWDKDRYTPHASEGGHSSFAPNSALQIGLLEYLLEHHKHVSTERVCSGTGIPNIYAYLKDRGIENEPDWLRDELAQGVHFRLLADSSYFLP
jgi:glucokinase